jgi:hypothetical protein
METDRKIEEEKVEMDPFDNPLTRLEQILAKKTVAPELLQRLNQEVEDAVGKAQAELGRDGKLAKSTLAALNSLLEKFKGSKPSIASQTDTGAETDMTPAE